MRARDRTAFRISSIASVIVATVALTGCAASAASTPSPVPTVTVTTTTTATATPTPTPVQASPDDPMTALVAWTACAVLGAQEYLSQSPGTELRPYNPVDVKENPDGTYQAMVGMTLPPGTHEGVGSNVAICTIGGTLGAPKLISFTLKDI